MIRHIVAFALASTDPQERTAHADEARTRLEALVGVVPGLNSLSVSRDLGLVETNYDLVLVSEHTDAEALKGYQTHPAHLEAATFVRSVTSARATVDFEI